MVGGDAFHPQQYGRQACNVQQLRREQCDHKCLIMQHMISQTEDAQVSSIQVLEYSEFTGSIWSDGVRPTNNPLCTKYWYKEASA